MLSYYYVYVVYQMFLDTGTDFGYFWSIKIVLTTYAYYYERNVRKFDIISEVGQHAATVQTIMVSKWHNCRKK